MNICSNGFAFDGKNISASASKRGNCILSVIRNLRKACTTRDVSPFSYDAASDDRKIQCLSLTDFRCQAKWQPEALPFQQFALIVQSMPHVRHVSCVLRSESGQEKLINTDYTNADKWRGLLANLGNVLDFTCTIKCPLKASNYAECNFVRISANVSRASEKCINVHLRYNNDIDHHTKSDVSARRLAAQRIAPCAVRCS